MQKPNILFVFSDQQRWCDLGFRNPDIITPRLDQFAREGTSVSNFYSNCPVCVPARGTLLTGLYPKKHGAITNDFRVYNETRSIANVLNENGYDTAYIGKWHLGGVPRDQFITEEKRLGFKYWRGCNCNHHYLKSYYDDNDNVRHAEEGYEPRIQTRLALEYLDSTERGKPFALYLSFGTPHDPYEFVPQETRELYNPENFTLRKNVSFPALRSQTIKFDETNMRSQIQGYFAHITELDNAMGALLDKLDEIGEAENTIVIYTSDHGNMLGSHGYTDKQLPYEESSRIPFIARYGKKLKGEKGSISSLVDLTPTILSLAGIDITNEKFDGKDRSAMLLGEEDGGGAYCVEYIPCHQATLRGSGEWRLLRYGDYKIVRGPYKNSDENEWETELYDLKNDPYELNNVAKDEKYKNILDDMIFRIDGEVAKHDAYQTWTEFIRKNGYTEFWNESQKYFGLEGL